jgi:hypothetical protein
MDGNHEQAKDRWSAVMLLLLIPFLVLWVPLYNTIEPTLFGFPFFYWFQLGWIFVSMIITAAVYFVTEQRQK